MPLVFGDFTVDEIATVATEEHQRLGLRSPMSVILPGKDGYQPLGS